MSSAATIRAASQVECHPWPRYVLTPAAWAGLVADDIALEAVWADTTAVYALFKDATGEPLLASCAVDGGRYAALSSRFPAGSAPERMVRDLWGHEAVGKADQRPDERPDKRPWLDHGQWGFTTPMAPRHGPAAMATEPVFRPVAEALMQLPIGPVTGRLQEPVHLRVATDGRVAHSVEARLGYAHKGALVLVRGKTPRAAARFAARLSAAATVAHSLAFARATEAALGVEVPLRAAVLRGVMAEVERVATHLGDLASACPGVTRFAWHREHLLRASAAAFGHRMMMDCVVPGGIAADIAAGGEAALLACLAPLLADAAGLSRQLAQTGEGVGRLPGPALHAFTPGGVVGRAAGVVADARMAPGYPPYQRYAAPILSGGDTAARLQLRMLEVETSIALLQSWLTGLPPGAVGQSLPPGSGEGLAVAESAGGAVWHWLRLDGGTIGSAFFADPAWRLWPALEAASEGAALADLALIEASFACTRSGIDL